MKLSILCAVSMFALLSCSLEAGAAAGTTEAVVAADESALADAAARAALGDGLFAGIAVAVSRNGKIVYRNGFGLADVERRIPVNVDTRFPVGSITKPITCLSLQQLAAAGRVDTDAKAGRYLPDLPAPARDVALRHLLDHTSGIENYIEVGEFPYRRPTGLSRGDMTAFFAGKPLRFPSGEKFSYSNSNTYLLGLIIEAVSGESYDTYVKGHVFAPLGMTRSDFEARPEGDANRALGYQSRSGMFSRAIGYDWLVPFSAGAAVSTAPDLLRFADGLFGEATKSVHERLLVHGTLGDGTRNAYTQGCLVEGRLGDARRFSHSGAIYGFSAHFAHYPDQKLSVAVLTNSQGENFGAITLSNRIARIFLGQSEPEQIDRPLDTAAASWIAGDYRVGNRRLGIDRLRFSLRDGKLWLETGTPGRGGQPGEKQEIPLVHLGENRFVSPRDSEQRFRFEKSAEGVKVLLDYHGGDMPFHRVSE